MFQKNFTFLFQCPALSNQSPSNEVGEQRISESELFTHSGISLIRYRELVPQGSSEAWFEYFHNSP